MHVTSLHLHQPGGSAPFPLGVSAFIVCRRFADGHSDWRSVTPPCGSDLHVSIIAVWRMFSIKKIFFSTSMSEIYFMKLAS